MPTCRTSLRLGALALWCALAACGPGPDAPAPEASLGTRHAPVGLPLTCPAGVSVCTGAGARATAWVPVVGTPTGRSDVGQVFEVPVRAWPGVVRLVLKRELPGSKTKVVPAVLVEVRSASATGLPNGPVLARGTVDVSALPCTVADGDTCDGEATPVEVPLIPVRGAQRLQLRINGKGQRYVLTVGGDGSGMVKVRVAAHAQPFNGLRVQGELVRGTPAARWSPGKWSAQPAGSALAFSLTLDWERVSGCTDGRQNGDETAPDCGAGCGPCPIGRTCARDGDCQPNATCRGGQCQARGANGTRCTRGAECQSGHCTFAGTCRPAACNNGAFDPGELDVDCGGPCDGCEEGSPCTVGGDCASGVCGAGAAGTCLAQSCVDGARASDEVDVDCGGPCPPCARGLRCLEEADCATGACVRGTCVEPGCRDGARNGVETDVDCGGSCSPCLAGRACQLDTDCESGACENEVCAAATCTDGVKNGAEVGVDCGGVCGPCTAGQPCTSGSHCASRVCSVARTCSEPTCSDRVLNGTESDVDCGGGCPPCEASKRCLADAECTTGRCAGGKCERSSCTDGVRSSGEGDVDCGGGCQVRCALGQSCRAHRDCDSGRCAEGVCVSGSCADGVRTDSETGVDCGGGTCGACSAGKRCLSSSDCASAACLGGVCRTASCTDGLANGRETGTDCGGPCQPCADNGGCTSPSDCITQVCTDLVCAPAGASDKVRNGRETDVDCGGPDVTKRCAPGRRCARTKDCYRNALCLQNICSCPRGAICKDAPNDGTEEPGPDSVCASYASGTVCVCRDGFAGDGYACEDIDECLDGTLACGADASCVNDVGSAHCECKDGLRMVDGVCRDVDECVDSPCDFNATCFNMDGGYYCQCNAPDWMGNGFTCEPTNTAPRINGVSLAPDTPTKSGPITALPGSTYDAEGQTVQLIYQWTVNGVVSQETSNVLPVTGFNRGDIVAVKVTPFDGSLYGAPATSSVRVANSAPNTPVVQWGATTVAGSGLDCVVTTPVADPDGDLVRYRYTLTVNGVQRAVSSLTTNRSYQLSGLITSDGGQFECKVEATDSSYWATPVTISLTLNSACSWSTAASYPLTSRPAGSVVVSGAVGGQGVASVGGRTAWQQTSDFNQFFVPSVVTSSDDVVAVSVDVYAPNDTTFVLGTLTDPAGINDIIRGFDVGYDKVHVRLGASSYASYSRQSTCCSFGASLGVSTAFSSAPYNAWHTLRVEHRKYTSKIRAFFDGTEMFWPSGSGIFWNGRYVRLDSGGPGSFLSSNVAFSNLIVERGTGGCFKSAGSPCSDNPECASSLCVDGVCCNTACTGTCMACNVAGRAGTCSNVPSNMDPEDECAGALVCNGSGACW